MAQGAGIEMCFNWLWDAHRKEPGYYQGKRWTLDRASQVTQFAWNQD